MGRMTSGLDPPVLWFLSYFHNHLVKIVTKVTTLQDGVPSGKKTIYELLKINLYLTQSTKNQFQVDSRFKCESQNYNI